MALVAALNHVMTGGWSNEAIRLIEDVTMCAKWDPVMVKVLDYSSKPPLVTIVNTSGDQVGVAAVVLLLLITMVTGCGCVM